MEITIPIVVVGLLFLQAYLYGKAILMRRMVMMKRVTDFLERNDASEQLKKFAVAAFRDAVSFKFPFQLVSYRKKSKENHPAAKRAEKRVRETFRKDKSSIEARQELDELIEMMFVINFSFNKFMIFIAFLPHVKFEKKPSTRDFYAESYQHDQLGMRKTC